MLLFNKKVSAQEACDLGLVTEVFPDKYFQTEVWKRIEAYAKLPKGVRLTSNYRTQLHTVNGSFYLLIVSLDLCCITMFNQPKEARARLH